MRKNMSKKKLIIFLIGTAFFWTFFYSHFTYGGGVGEWFSGGLQWLIQAFSAVFLKIVNFFMSLIVATAYFFASLVGSLLKWIVTLDLPLTRCPDASPNCVIKVGWTITRDFSNVLLIFIFIIIVFATILGFETYSMRRLLPKLLLVALLINFSQLICGIPVDIASVFMNTFFGGDTSSIDKMLNGPLTSIGGILSYWWSSDTLNLQKQSAFLMQTLFLILFAYGFVFLVGLYFLIFFLRIPVLWTLTILSPLAFVSMILPGPPGFPFARSFWEEWISQFLQWTFVGVFAMFFLWLGVHLVYNLGDASFKGIFDFTSVDVESESPEVAEAGGQMNAFIQNTLGFSVLLGFLALGAMFTFRTNLWFAGAVMAAGAGVYSRYVSPAAVGARVGRWGAKRGREIKEGVKERARKVPIAVWERMPEKLKKIPYKIPGTKVKYEEYKRKIGEEEKRKFEEGKGKMRVYSSAELPGMIAEYKRIPLSKEAERQSLRGIEVMLERGEYEKLKEGLQKKLGDKKTKELMNLYFKRMQEMGRTEKLEEIVKKNPQLLSREENISEARRAFSLKPGEETMYRDPLDKLFAKMKRGEYENISAEALRKHPEVLDTILQRADVETLATLGSKAEIRDIIQKRWAEIKNKEENERTPEERKIIEKADDMWQKREHRWRLERVGYLQPGTGIKEEGKGTRIFPFESIKEKLEAERRKKEIGEEKKKIGELLEKEGIPEQLKQNLKNQEEALEEEEKLLEKRIEATDNYIDELKKQQEREIKAYQKLEETLKEKGKELSTEGRRMIEEKLSKAGEKLEEIERQIEEFEPKIRERIKIKTGRGKRKIKEKGREKIEFFRGIKEGAVEKGKGILERIKRKKEGERL